MDSSGGKNEHALKSRSFGNVVKTRTGGGGVKQEEEETFRPPPPLQLLVPNQNQNHKRVRDSVALDSPSVVPPPSQLQRTGTRTKVSVSLADVEEQQVLEPSGLPSDSGSGGPSSSSAGGVTRPRPLQIGFGLGEGEPSPGHMGTGLLSDPPSFGGVGGGPSGPSAQLNSLGIPQPSLSLGQLFGGGPSDGSLNISPFNTADFLGLPQDFGPPSFGPPSFNLMSPGVMACLPSPLPRHMLEAAVAAGRGPSRPSSGPGSPVRRSDRSAFRSIFREPDEPPSATATDPALNVQGSGGSGSETSFQFQPLGPGPDSAHQGQATPTPLHWMGAGGAPTQAQMLLSAGAGAQMQGAQLEQVLAALRGAAAGGGVNLIASNSSSQQYSLQVQFQAVQAQAQMAQAQAQAAQAQAQAQVQAQRMRSPEPAPGPPASQSQAAAGPSATPSPPRNLNVPQERAHFPTVPQEHAESCAGLAGPRGAGERSACHCKKTRCLKLYCICFSQGRYCHQACSCVAPECENLPGHETAIAAGKAKVRRKHPSSFARVDVDASPVRAVSLSQTDAAGSSPISGGLSSSLPAGMDLLNIGGGSGVGAGAGGGAGAGAGLSGVRAPKPIPISTGKNAGHFVRVIGTCTCKKTKCLKKYCQCFAAGVACGPTCQCEDCGNGKPQ